jgi:hypothetical protein
MSESVGLYFTQIGTVVGCKKVVDNLLSGLNELGIQVCINSPGDLNGCVHGGIPAFDNRTLPSNTLIGPEIMVLPNEMSWAWGAYKNWTQPSQWVVDYMQTSPLTTGINFHVWPVGINTDMFNENNRGGFQRDCFIYYKTVTKQVNQTHLDSVIAECTKLGLSYEVITYGTYTEAKYRELINTSKFGIFLTGTESQGIAYMEALAMGLPLYIIEVNEFYYELQNYRFTSPNVSAAPYFDSRCGVKHKDLSQLPNFIQTLGTYTPRSYILDNHTVKLGATKYMNILRSIK